MISGGASIPVVVLLSYLLGSIPTSLILGKILRGIDIREHGSGNAGATNTFRVLGTGPGIVAILVDIGKAIVATLFVARVGDQVLLSGEAFSLIAGSSAVIGHIWTVFAGFRGGKGVGAAAGMLVALYPVAFLSALALFVLGILVSGAVSIGSITAAIAFPSLIWIFDLTGIADYSPLLKVVCIPVGLLIIFTHRKNLSRLFAGTEHRFPRLMVLRSKAARERVIRDAERKRDADQR